MLPKPMPEAMAWVCAMEIEHPAYEPCVSAHGEPLCCETETTSPVRTGMGVREGERVRVCTCESLCLVSSVSVALVCEACTRMDVKRRGRMLSGETSIETDCVAAETERLPQGIGSTALARGEQKGKQGCHIWEHARVWPSEVSLDLG